jgi:outer membrane lipopolysaccharide assembly protein LptE/RlpB
MHHGGASTDPEFAVSVDLATPTDQTIDPRVVVLQRQYAEIGEDLTALTNRIAVLEKELNRPLSEFLVEAGVRS